MLSLRPLLFLRCAALAALIFPATRTAFEQQQPQPQLVESVNVTGIRRRKSADLLSQIKTRPGDPYDHEQAVRDFQTLMNLGLFDRRTSRVVFETGQRGGVEIFFELRELPLIESVKFEGLRRADVAALLEGLRRRKLALDGGGGVYEPEKIAKAINVMDELLYRRGWREVKIETRVEQIASDSVKLTFVVSGRPPMNVLPKRLDRPARRDAIA